MAAHSPQSAVMVPVQSQSTPENYWAWLQHLALAANQVMQWCNRPRLVPLTFDTLPTDPQPGELAYITDGAVLSGRLAGGGTTPSLVWYDGTKWERILAS